ncbi:MAG TPA: hypothetical protein VF179_31365 [Thermoanaerobaculia bacterium]|nr:hypothetical protein [Thermoanaerobaculia bacterium]
METEPSVLDTLEDPSVTDPLSEVTRRERKALLAACVVGLAITAGGVVPDKIETFGISLTPNQESLLYILGGVIAYFLMAFAVYAWSDLKRRESQAARQRERLKPVFENAVSAYRRTQEQLKSNAPDSLTQTFSDPEVIRLATLSEQTKFVRRVQRVGAVRIAVDVYFPMVAGVTAIIAVWSSTGGFPGWAWVGWGALTASVPMGALVLWWRRREVHRWWRKKRRDRRNKKQKELMQKAQALPEDDPRKAELLAKARDLLMKTIEDMRDGIF